MKIDEQLKSNLIADVENIADTNLRPQTKEALKRAFEITIGHHYVHQSPTELRKEVEGSKTDYKAKYEKCISVIKKFDVGIIGMYDL